MFYSLGGIDMDNLSAYKGINQFGRAYEIMLENDIHGKNSVDRVIFENMIRLCDDTKEYLYGDYTKKEIEYILGSRADLESLVYKLISEVTSVEDKIIKIVSFCSRLYEIIESDDLDDMIFGGTEEHIMKRGSNWCTNISRVACILYQLIGLPSRIIQLFNIHYAYSGHVVVEVFRNNTWGVVDPTNDIGYSHIDGTHASAWNIMNGNRDVLAKDSSGHTSDIDFNQFSGIAISNYYINDHINYDYSVSGINQYYKGILEMNDKGWPGGIRWLYGE